jgi:cytidine deaminase
MEEIIEYAKKRYNEIRIIQKNNKHDVYFTVVKSSSGKYYDSTPLHNDLSPICCERLAIAQMITHEGKNAKVIELILVGAIGEGGTLSPCGICRQVIYDNSPDAKIIVCSGKFGKDEDCNFIFDNPIYYTIKDLLPFAWKLGEW